jgi:hypothetical protein
MGSAVGSYSDVAILTDLKALGPVALQLERSLEAPVAYSLKPEPLFNVDLFDMSDRRNAEIYKNVVVVGLVDGEDRGSRELRRRLGGEALSDSRHKDLFLAVEQDVYSRNQLVFYVAGRERSLLQSAIGRNIGILIDRMEEENRARMRNYLFSDGHEVALEARVRHEMHFGIQVPASYHETRFRVGSEEGLVEAMAVGPTRGFSVYYLENADSTMVTDQDLLLEMRRSWGARFLEENLQDIAGFEWDEAPLGGRQLPVLSGFWEAKKGDYGGPFQTYFYFDPNRQRLYGINVLCYAPGMRKHPLIREALAVAETFQP